MKLVLMVVVPYLAKVPDEFDRHLNGVSQAARVAGWNLQDRVPYYGHVREEHQGQLAYPQQMVWH